MKKLKSLALILGMGLCLSAIPVQAQGVWGECTDNEVAGSSKICKDDSNAFDIVKTIINTLLFVIGVLAVIMIIHSGLKYTISRGDAEQVKNAKNTLMYAVVGLIVAMLAFAIVNFVVGLFVQPSGGSDQTSAMTGGRLA